MTVRPFGWIDIVRLGLAQTALGAIVVLTTSTLNRVMVVELALPAVLPGALVAWHFALQVLRPRMGHGSDQGSRRTPWIIGGMATLAAGGVLAAIATAIMAGSVWFGTLLAVIAFTLIGVGVSAAGTSLLVLLAKRVAPERRPAAATIVWLMMIAGFAITATIAGQLLDPFSPARLVAVAAGVSVVALALTVVALWKVEGPAQSNPHSSQTEQAGPAFFDALGQVWAEPEARRFTIFVFVSMLAYSMQDLILEPFGGTVFAMTPGESTKLGGVQHSGVFCGMVLVAVLGSAVGGPWFGSLKAWTIGGCLASAAALSGLVCAGLIGPAWPLRTTVFVLGIANGAFAIAAIGSMMTLAGNGRERREGVRMGLWGAAQAIAFGLGGFLGALAADVARHVMASQGAAYALVFSIEALLFVVAAVLAFRIGTVAPRRVAGTQQGSPMSLAGRGFVAETSGV